MTDSRLLPPSIREPRSQAFLEIAGRLGDLDLTALLVYYIDIVPASALPHLARQFDIEILIDADTPEITIRRLLKRAIAIHRRRGTNSAIIDVLAAAGFTAEIVEWWQTDPEGTPNTFDLTAFIRPDAAAEGLTLDAALIARLERLVRWAKRKSQGHTLALGIETRCGIPVIAAALTAGETATVYPYSIGEIEVSNSVPVVALGHYGVETVTLYPM